MPAQTRKQVMKIDLIVQADAWKGHDLMGWANDAAFALMDRVNLPQGLSISILACNDAQISGLNGDFRGVDKPTNVLAWPSHELSPDTNGIPPKFNAADGFLGDIAIAYETCAREADQQGKKLHHHGTHLCLHAMLHLLGYDHQNDTQADIMEGLEISILAKLGIENPYYTADA